MRENSATGMAKASYSNTVMGRRNQSVFNKMEELDEGLISNDDVAEEEDGKTGFGMGMT